MTVMPLTRAISTVHDILDIIGRKRLRLYIPSKRGSGSGTNYKFEY